MVAALTGAASAQVASTFGFLPENSGGSATYRYEGADATARSSKATHAVVRMTRLGTDDVSIDVYGEGAPVVITPALILEDGTLQPFSRQASPTPSASPTSQYQRGKRPSTSSPFIVTPEPAATAPPPPPFPQALGEVLSLLVTAGRPGDFPRTWSFTPSALSGPLTLSLSRTIDGTQTTFVADGGLLTNAVHVEVVLRENQFVSARGMTKVVTSDVDQNQIATTTWSLTR